MDERSPERNYGSFINHPCASEELHLKPHIGKKEEAPEWLVDNQFIFHGYRIGFYRVKDVLKSLFMWHNETTNIWSHLAGVILFIFLILYIVFCVGGMEFTRPLDTIIDKYDSVNFKISKLENDITQSPVHSETRQQLFSNTSAQEFFNISIKLWINEVELANPYYFKSIQQDSEQSTEEEREASQVHQTKASLEAQLYDTSLDYLLLLIQKFTLENRTNEQNREDLYKIFKSIQPVLIGRIDSMIEYHNQNGFGKKASHLVNLERNVNYHFNSDIVRTLIITGNLKENYSKVHEVTRIPMYIHMIAAIICLSLSSLFHLFTCWNQSANNYLSRLDYGGISFLIAGSWMPPYFYSFYCEETRLYAFAYSGMIFTICLAAFIVTLLPRFDQPKFRKFRAILYIAAGLSTAIPWFHLIFAHQLYVYPFPQYYWIIGGAVYIGGAIIYSIRFPEKFFPKIFDYFGSSHNIFHFCVLIAAIIHFFGSMANYNGRMVLVC